MITGLPSLLKNPQKGIQPELKVTTNLFRGKGHGTDEYCQRGLVPSSNRAAVVSLALNLETLTLNLSTLTAFYPFGEDPDGSVMMIINIWSFGGVVRVP